MTEPTTPPELELEFPPKPEYVRAVRHTVAALASMSDFPDELVEDVKLAVSEACTNALVANAESSGDDGEAAPVVVLVASDEDGIELRVLDRGLVPLPEVSGSPIELSTEDLPFDRALSLPLIRGLVDDLEITHRDGGGSVIRMRLHARVRGGE
jgi:serine/threonine-protein kinase RsbW